MAMLLPCTKALDGAGVDSTEGSEAGDDTGPGPTGAGGEAGISGAAGVGDELTDGPGLIVGSNATGAGGDITGATGDEGATMLEGGIVGA
ncbi:hypothetical protein FXO37_28304 [Capsicum annuum]|nr:hypothetical protein FXO37_28304 [Capsicum annuum]